MRFFVALLAWCVVACAPAAAQEPVIYRCTDASGNVTMQNNVPCPKGQQQQIRRVQALPSAPPPAEKARGDTSAPPPPAGDFELVRGPVDGSVDAEEIPTLPLAKRSPPPPLFQCTTHDQDRYLSETATPEPKCVAIDTTGIDGSAERGAGLACEMRSDPCEPVAADALCRAWKRRMDEAEFRWRFARAGNDDPRRIEYERLAKTWRDSDCAR